MTKTNKLRPLIDGDILIYRCGFSADAQAKKEYPNSWQSEDYLSWALGNTRTTIEGVLGKFPQADGSDMYITGSGNFREQIASLQPYKGNRDPAAKPRYYNEIKTYLLDYWQAKLITGREADDAMGCEQYKHPEKSTVICSIDKDMKQIPGYHYNWMKDDLSYVKILDANLFFYRQMLEGDRVDNIPGIRGVGPKTVDKMMAECANDLSKVKTKVEQYYVDQYGDSSAMAYDEVATLLFIQREEGKGYKDYGL